MQATQPTTGDHAAMVARSADGAIVGRATLSRLYGARGELQLELAPTAVIALALIDALEISARTRGMVQLELDPTHVPSGALEALRRSRPIHESEWGTHLHLTWPTTRPLVTS